MAWPWFDPGFVLLGHAETMSTQCGKKNTLTITGDRKQKLKQPMKINENGDLGGCLYDIGSTTLSSSHLCVVPKQTASRP